MLRAAVAMLYSSPLKMTATSLVSFQAGLLAAGQIVMLSRRIPSASPGARAIAGKKAFFIRTAMFHRRGHRPHAAIRPSALREAKADAARCRTR